MSRFVGRGEDRVEKILNRIFPFLEIESQVPMKKLIPEEEWQALDEVYQKHKFDFTIAYNRFQFIAAIEVNYKHGNGASKKWMNIFAPHLKRSCIAPVAINDYECKSLFNTKDERPLRWDDFIDVINALKMAGVSP